jgi:23S rRNA (uracil1939-C5)-methyltransferase
LKKALAKQCKSPHRIERGPVWRELQLEFRLVELTIEKLVYGGDGLARLSGNEQGRGKSVFVPFVLERERVTATEVEEKPGFVRARLDGVRESSAVRVVPACPYFQGCGGCHYQHSNYQHQLQIKVAIFRETLLRTGKVELPCALEIHPSPPWNYRNRTRLKVQISPAFSLGYYRFRSHDFLPVEQCPISSPLINRAIREILAAGRRNNFSVQPYDLELFANHRDDALLLEAYCAPMSRRQANHFAEGLKTVMPSILGVAIFQQTRAGQPEPIATRGEPHIFYKTALFSYRVSAGSFFQVNRFLIDDLVGTVLADAVGQTALDLYAGVGLFSAGLARSFAQVIAVEASQRSYCDLRHNAPPSVKAVRGTTEQYLEHASRGTDFVIADPPRGGLGVRVVRNLARMGPARIRYVSCDPATLARDVAGFVSFGYRIERCHLFDLFPQTYHIESVLSLAR